MAYAAIIARCINVRGTSNTPWPALYWRFFYLAKSELNEMSRGIASTSLRPCWICSWTLNVGDERMEEGRHKRFEEKVSNPEESVRRLFFTTLDPLNWPIFRTATKFGNERVWRKKSIGFFFSLRLSHDLFLLFLFFYFVLSAERNVRDS